jgi:hypothetical protein
VWLVPITFTGLTQRSVPMAGPYLNNLYRVACFFTERVPAWSEYYFQALPAGSYEWITLAETDYSTLEPFGHRTRLHRMLSETDGRQGTRLRQRMAEFIKHRHKSLHPQQPQLEAVRFVVVSYETGKELAQSRGPWMQQPFDDIPRDRRHVVATHFFDGRPPIETAGQPVPGMP